MANEHIKETEQRTTNPSSTPPRESNRGNRQNTHESTNSARQPNRERSPSNRLPPGREPPPVQRPENVLEQVHLTHQALGMEGTGSISDNGEPFGLQVEIQEQQHHTPTPLVPENPVPLQPVPGLRPAGLDLEGRTAAGRAALSTVPNPLDTPAILQSRNPLPGEEGLVRQPNLLRRAQAGPDNRSSPRGGDRATPNNLPEQQTGSPPETQERQRSNRRRQN